jgi:hypothetical protein
LVGLTSSVLSQAHNGAGVTIALYDGLTDCTHPDLAGRCTNVKIAGGVYNHYDIHGTHTAGIAVGDQFGIAGGASLINYAVFDDKGYVATGNKLFQAWVAGAGSGASIASMSFGCTGLAMCFTDPELNTIATVDMLFVKAAGNDGIAVATETTGLNQASVSALLSKFILVGSVDVHGNLSTFSNMPGTTCLMAVDATTCDASNEWMYHFIVAPGQNIYSTSLNGRYVYLSGTSMATPVVAGAAALIEAAWPNLKTQPATVAQILFTSATDLGAPGVDPVYGWGLLNINRAFQNSGQTIIQTPTGKSMVVSDRSFTSSSMLGDVFGALKNVVAYDAFGRAYKLDQLSNFHVSRNLSQALWSAPAGRIAQVGRQSDWTQSFFGSDHEAPRAWASFGATGQGLGQGFSLSDTSLRVGVDTPVPGGGLMQFRLTGAANTRADFAADDALKPLSFFASSELFTDSALVGYSRSFTGTDRLVMFGIGSMGEGYMPQQQLGIGASGPGGPSLADQPTSEFAAAYDFLVDRSPRKQAGVGVGYWMQPDDRTVVGVTASTLVQRHAFFDVASDLTAFDQPTHVFNLGGAASRQIGRWDMYGSAEVSQVNAPGGVGPIRFTDMTLVSGEFGMRRANLFFDGRRASDSFSFSLEALPEALAGSIALNYLGPTADGTGTQVVNTKSSLSDLTGRIMRFESAYTVKGRDSWSYALTSGINLNGPSPDYALMGTMSLRF